MDDPARNLENFSSGCSLRCGAVSGCRDCQELAELAKEEERAETIARQAKTRRSALLARVNSRRDLLTSNLPLEIVCYIFEEYVQLHQIAPMEYISIVEIASPRFFPPIHRSAPLRLGAVCRHWRSIAWAHSRLWKTLVVAISSPGHELGPTMVEEWLQRTGEQQLEVQMNDYRTYQDTLAAGSFGRSRIMGNAMLVVRALNSVSSRWRSLDLSECPLYILSSLDDTGCATESVLQHLCLGYQSDQRRSHDTKLLKGSRHKHGPTHLNLLCAIRPSRLNIEWKRLTHLYLENMSCKHCLRTLSWMTKSSPALRHLTLHLMDNHLHINMDAGTYNLRHPSLESLVIYEENCYRSTTHLLFSAFTLPALRTLKYNGRGEAHEFPTGDFLDLLGRSLCSLETLEMTKPFIKDNALAHLLRAVPTIHTLKIKLTQRNRSAHLFDCLAQKHLHHPPALPFLPDLARLDITARAPEDWKTFIGMFADDPTVSREAFGLKQPTRDSLQVTFKVQPGTGRREMDLDSLSQLALLWRKHQFFVVLQYDGDEFYSPAGKSKFLLQSYRIGTTMLLGRRVFKTELEVHLTAMSGLSFRI